MALEITYKVTTADGQRVAHGVFSNELGDSARKEFARNCAEKWYPAGCIITTCCEMKVKEALGSD